jgi:GNAT superfamily N-acetyltransferase
MFAGGSCHYVLLQETYYRDDSGRLIGVLRHWPTGFTLPGANKKKGEYGIAVLATSRRRGVGMALLTAADQEWGLDFWCQTYTDAGRSLAIAYLNKRHGSMIADKKSTLAMATPIVNAVTS